MQNSKLVDLFLALDRKRADHRRKMNALYTKIHQDYLDYAIDKGMWESRMTKLDSDRRAEYMSIDEWYLLERSALEE